MILEHRSQRAGLPHPYVIDGLQAGQLHAGGSGAPYHPARRIAAYPAARGALRVRPLPQGRPARRAHASGGDAVSSARNNVER